MGRSRKGFNKGIDFINKGVYGENIAEGYLIEKGYSILNRRYKCPFGEIDLIARKGSAIVFIEVKMRRTVKAGLAAESVTKSKRRSIIKTALHYIAYVNSQNDEYRFDVVEVYGMELYSVNHIENAFYAEN